MEEALKNVELIVEACNARHEENRLKHEAEYLKKIGRAVWRSLKIPAWVIGTLFVAFIGLTGWNLKEVYRFNADSATREQIIDQQTLNLLIEQEARNKSDERLEKTIKEVDKKLDEKAQWLIDNMYSKYRGASPLYKNSKPTGNPNPQ